MRQNAEAVCKVAFSGCCLTSISALALLRGLQYRSLASVFFVILGVLYN
jgi:uncharacterized membrane protein